jgi:hypothetical protein
VFLVQSATSANLAVTAVVAWRVLGTHLGQIEKAAVVAVCAGLVVLGLFSGRQGASHGVLALVGVLVTIIGALTLARFGDVSEDTATADPARRGRLLLVVGSGVGGVPVVLRVLVRGHGVQGPLVGILVAVARARHVRPPPRWGAPG